jgi:hypothetical protein
VEVFARQILREIKRVKKDLKIRKEKVYQEAKERREREEKLAITIF